MVATHNMATGPLTFVQAASCISTGAGNANTVSSATSVCRRIDAHFMSDTDMSGGRAMHHQAWSTLHGFLQAGG